MTNVVKHASLETRACRASLKRGRQPHWQSLVPGKEHLGYIRWPERAGRPLVWRHRLGSRRRLAGIILPLYDHHARSCR